jgi:hypothetical protein
VHVQLPVLSKAGLASYFSMMPISSQGDASRMDLAFLIYALSSTPDILEKTLDPIMARLNATVGLDASIMAAPLPRFRLFQTSFLAASRAVANV